MLTNDIVSFEQPGPGHINSEQSSNPIQVESSIYFQISEYRYQNITKLPYLNTKTQNNKTASYIGTKPTLSDRFTKGSV